MTNSKKATLLVLFMILNQFVLSFFWVFITDIFHIGYETNFIFSEVLMFIFPLTIYFLITKENIIETLNIRPLRLINIPIIIALGIFIQPFMSFLSAISTLIFPNDVAALMGETMEVNIIYLIIGIGIFPAICEELFFRGAVFSGFNNTNIFKASIMTGLYFGIMHLNGQQFLYAFALGIFFCFLVYKTKSIFSSMLMHFVINTSQLLFARLSFSQLSKTEILQSLSDSTIYESLLTAAMTFILFCITLPLLAGLIWLFLYVNKSEYNPYFNPPKYLEEKVLNIPFVIIIVIYIIFAIIPPIIMTFINNSLI